ncbi:MAG: sensor histidine kinase [Planctomycetota bacterium]|jgi:signal transduction histidine kinase
MEVLLETTRLTKRAFWLVRIRWLAILALCIAVFAVNSMIKISLPTTKLYILACIVIIYNLMLFLDLKYLAKCENSDSHKMIKRIVIFQISVDFIILITILHFSGGIENPFFLYFVFHMIIASTLLSTKQSYIQATFAIVLFGSLVMLEYQDIIHHYSLSGFIDAGLYQNPLFVSGTFYQNPLFVSGTFFILATTLYLVVYMTTSITNQLRKQQLKAENANLLLLEKDHLKDEYVMRLTHDIKGHLAAIQGCLEVVEKKMVGPLNEKQSDLVERAHRRADKCLTFIRALLRLTRMKMTGKLEMDYFSFRNAVFNIISSGESRAAEKNIKITYEIDPNVDEIFGEQVLIEETLMNLLSNAIKYTQEGGKVDLSVKKLDNGVLVQISDTGIGVPHEQLGKVFEEFHRAENARKIERDGTGLGLSIAKQVIERHNGKIWAQNNPDVGTTFSFILPQKLKKQT